MSELTLPFTLTDGERHTPLWVNLSKHLTEKLVQLRGKNDGPLSHDETLTLRGQIQSLKVILALGDEPPNDGTNHRGTETRPGSRGN